MSDKIPTTNHDTLYTLYGLRVTDKPIPNRYSSLANELVEYFSKHLNECSFPTDFEIRLEQAITDYPELPEFRYFHIIYMTTYARIEQAEQASRDLVRDFPDFLLARISLAQLLIKRKELEEVKYLLGNPIDIKTLLGNRDVYHERDVMVYYFAAIQLALAYQDINMAGEYLTIMILTNPGYSTTINMAVQVRKMQMALVQEELEHDEKYERHVKSFSTVEYESINEPPKLRHSELEVFYHTKPEDMDADTIAAIRALPRASLRADLEAILIDSILRYNYFSSAGLTEDECCAPLHAFYWLGTFAMEESLPLVLDWMRQGQAFTYFWTDEMTVDVLFDSFYLIAKNRLPDLLAYVKEPNQCDAMRTMAATVVAKVGLEEEGRRAEAVEWLREVARYTLAHLDDDALIDTRFLATWVTTAITFQCTELWPEIQEFYALHLIPVGSVGTLKDVKRDIFEQERTKYVVGYYGESVMRSYEKGFPSDDVKLPSNLSDDRRTQQWDIIFEYTNKLYNRANNSDELESL
ncbi:MAG: hypothetical protein RIR11_4786 [Bacteroidota bacterium]|jgi:hypothetical protein